MSKEVIVVFSDLHFVCLGRENRIDLMREQMLLKSEIVRVCRKYENPIVVLLGDVFDRGFRIPHRLGEEMSFFVSLSGMVKSIYSVVGNHEITYYTNNPFWNLVTEVSSPYLNSIAKNTAPRGLANVVQIVDDLVVDGLNLKFNHYGQPLAFANPNELTVLFSHNPLYNDYLRSSSSGFIPKYTDSSKSMSSVYSYKLAFLGHMHWLYGTWRNEEYGKLKSTIYGLGALGRPNVEEIRDDFLERNMPAIHWNSSTKELFVEDNLVFLPKRSEVVREEFVLSEGKAETLVANLTENLDNTKFDSPLEALIAETSSDMRLSSILGNLRNGVDIAGDYMQRMQDIIKKKRGL